jgi:hypothetical protein
VLLDCSSTLGKYRKEILSNRIRVTAKSSRNPFPPVTSPDSYGMVLTVKKISKEFAVEPHSKAFFTTNISEIHTTKSKFKV